MTPSLSLANKPNLLLEATEVYMHIIRDIICTWLCNYSSISTILYNVVILNHTDV